MGEILPREHKVKVCKTKITKQEAVIELESALPIQLINKF